MSDVKATFALFADLSDWNQVLRTLSPEAIKQYARDDTLRTLVPFIFNIPLTCYVSEQFSRIVASVLKGAKKKLKTEVLQSDRSLECFRQHVRNALLCSTYVKPSTVNVQTTEVRLREVQQFNGL